MLKAINVSKSYGTQLVLKDVGINIEEGKFYTILGRSGSGKSTLLYLLSGLEKPDSGEIIYNNIDLAAIKDNEISRIRKTQFGFIFQFYNLINNISVQENIGFPLLLNKLKSIEMKERILGIAEKLNIQDKLNKFPYELSGGEQQRVAVARALVIKPRIIFADEPTGNLDSKSGIQLMELFKKIHDEEKLTILMVTHNESLAEYSNQIIKIDDGKIYY